MSLKQPFPSSPPAARGSSPGVTAPAVDLAHHPVVLLCGGRGVFLPDAASGERETGQRCAKGLVEIAGEPLLVHVLRHFVRHGARRFLLACGKDHARFAALGSALGPAVDEETRTPEAQAFAQISGAAGYTPQPAQAFRLRAPGLAGTLLALDTGAESSTAERLRRVRPFVEQAPWFFATYSDTLCTVDLREEARFHEAHGKLATCLAVRLPTRFRILGLRRGETQVRGFAERPVIVSDSIVGGFYALRPGVFGPAYLGSAGNAVFEAGVLEALARDGHLEAYAHEGQWLHFDHERDLPALAEAVAKAAR